MWHVLERSKMCKRVWYKILKEIDHLEDIDVGGVIILKWPTQK
jgi:hypothetical protein